MVVRKENMPPSGGIESQSGVGMILETLNRRSSYHSRGLIMEVQGQPSDDFCDVEGVGASAEESSRVENQSVDR